MHAAKVISMYRDLFTFLKDVCHEFRSCRFMKAIVCNDHWFTGKEIYDALNITGMI